MGRLDQGIERELDRFCAEAKRRGARAVLLFGSRAKGEDTEESDADVCLIADDLPEDLFQRRYPAPLGLNSSGGRISAQPTDGESLLGS